jgi:uncharacterized membrane protein
VIENERPALGEVTMKSTIGWIGVGVWIAVMTGCGKPGMRDETAEAPPPPTIAAAPQQADTAESQQLAYAFDCEDGTSVISRFDANDDVMWVLLPDRTVDLGRVPTASGARYSNGSVSYWNKGDELVLEVDGRSVTCTVDRFRSKVESVKLSGGDFWATGNEPGWTLEMYPDGMTFTTNYGEDVYRTSIEKLSEDAGARMTVFRGETDGKVLVVTLRGERCVDTMSGEEFETTVRIDFAGKVLAGCGGALH